MTTNKKTKVNDPTKRNELKNRTFIYVIWQKSVACLLRSSFDSLDYSKQIAMFAGHQASTICLIQLTLRPLLGTELSDLNNCSLLRRLTFLFARFQLSTKCVSMCQQQFPKVKSHTTCSLFEHSRLVQLIALPSFNGGNSLRIVAGQCLKTLRHRAQFLRLIFLSQVVQDEAPFNRSENYISIEENTHFLYFDEQQTPLTCHIQGVSAGIINI